MSYVMHFCTNRFHFLYYCLLLVLRTFAEDTDFLSFPRPELILFPTVENLGFSAGFSLVRTPDCFFVWPGPTPWWRRFMVDLKEGCTSTSSVKICVCSYCLPERYGLGWGLLFRKDWSTDWMFQGPLHWLSSVLRSQPCPWLPRLLAAPRLSWGRHSRVSGRPPRRPGGRVPGGDRGVHTSLDRGLVSLDREEVQGPSLGRLDDWHVTNKWQAPCVGVVNIHWLILAIFDRKYLFSV